MAAGETVSHDARELTRRFIDAFNDRDFDALREVVAEDVDLRKFNGDRFRGHEGLRTFLDEAEQQELRFVPFRTATVEEGVDRARIMQPLREVIGPDEIERTAEFEIRDGRIAAFRLLAFDES